MTSFLVSIVLFVTCYNCYGMVFNNKPISTETCEVTIKGRPDKWKRSASLGVDVMGDYYDVYLNGGAHRVASRVLHNDVLSGLVSYEQDGDTVYPVRDTTYGRDWAVYVSDEPKGVFTLYKTLDNIFLQGHLVFKNKLLKVENLYNGSYHLHTLSRNAHTSSNIPRELFNRPRKHRRGSLPPNNIYTLELLMVFDKQFTRVMTDFKKNHANSENVPDVAKLTAMYHAETIVQAHATYQSIKRYSPTLNIHVKSAGYHVLKREIHSPYRYVKAFNHNIRYTYDADDAINSFTTYMQRMKGFYYDHASLVTGYQLTSEGYEGVLGYAYANSACTKQAISVAIGGPGLELIFSTIHESGHSMGAAHDQDVGCRWGYTMSTEANTVFPREFSRCTHRAFYRYIQSLPKNNCLLNNIGSRQPSEKVYLGYHTSLTDQCRFSLSDEYVKAGNKVSTDCRAQCFQVRTNRRWKRSTIHVLNSTPCGKNKVCVNGVCR